MKGFLSCLAAMGWIGLVIYQMGPRRPLPLGCDIHGPGASCICFWKTQPSTPELDEAVDRAHSGDGTVCPRHGPECYRARGARRTGRAHDEHGAGGYTQQAIDQANRAHTGGHEHCPIHGSACGRAKRARETGVSQTDEDLARDEDLRRRAVTNGAH